MEEDTSGADRALPLLRPTLAFRRIVVVGGGCYGTYYVRQLARAASAGAVTWSELIVVDQNPACLVAQLAASDRPARLRVEAASWNDYFTRLLGEGSRNASACGADAIVPSPLMPHLMAEWLLRRARERWPDREVRVAPLASPPSVPWQMTGADGTHFVSFAEWICPINCIEPAKCPATKGERDWSLPTALAAYVANESSEGRQTEGPFVFHCSHRAYGVGMIDVSTVLAADTAIANRARHAGASFLIGTASHCHGALQVLEIGPVVPGTS